MYSSTPVSAARPGSLRGMHIDIPLDEVMPHAGDWIVTTDHRYVVLNVESLIPHRARDEDQCRLHLACRELDDSEREATGVVLFVMHSYDS